MRASEARMVMLVRAAEEGAPEGGLVPTSEVSKATRAARDEAGSEGERFLGARASLLVPDLVGRWPRAETLLAEGALGGAVARRARAAALVLLVVAALFGLLANELGHDREINILAFPLLGLIVWNLAVYLAMAVRACLGRRGGPVDTGGPAFGSLARWVVRPSESSGDQEGAKAEAERRFRKMALPLEWPSFLARARALVHAAAAVAAAGVLAGMYLRGLAVAYRASFESTFLSESGAQALLEVLLWPASAATGFVLRVPEVGTTDAAPWLHLYAITAVLAIVLPRMVLAVLSLAAAGRLSREVALAPGGDWEAYGKAALRSVEGGGNVIRVVPASLVPKARIREAVRALVAERWGGAAMVDFAGEVGYGEEDDFVRDLAEGPADMVFLMNLTTTPEAEYQRALVEGCVIKSGGGRHVVALDGSGFAARFAALPEYSRRFSERAAAWRRILRGSGVDEILVYGTVSPGGWIPLPGGGEEAA